LAYPAYILLMAGVFRLCGAEKAEFEPPVDAV
jgi:hypothetical protein